MEDKELAPLPESDNKEFWGDAQVIKKEIKHSKCDHLFKQTSATNILCEKCRAGFVLAYGWNLKNKKLYYNETLVF